MAKTIPLGAITVAKDINGGPPLQQFFPEAASQTFNAGKSVYLNGSGHVADFTAGIDSGSQRLLGFAAEDGNNLTTAVTANATNVGSTKSQINSGLIGVYISPYTIFEGNITSNGTPIAATLSHVAQLYPLYQDATNSYSHIDVADTGSKINCVNTLKPAGDGFAVGDTNQRFHFTLTPASLQVLGTN